MSKRKLLLFFLPTLLLSSCDRYLNRHIMMRTGSDYPFSEFGEFEDTEYRLAADDIIRFELYPNDGFLMINAAAAGGRGDIQEKGISLEILVEFDGFVKLPKIGRTYMEGLTLRQAELVLEDKFSEFYNKPFVLLTVINKRVTIMAGGNSSVVTLSNENTTLFEALAESGGVPNDGISGKVKLVRGDISKPEVYQLDLSTLQGVKEADLVLQANDIIYIETRPRQIERIAELIAPYASLISSFVISYTLITRLTPNQ